MMEGIKLVGIYGLTAVVIIIGYFLFEKSSFGGGALIIIGVILAVTIIISELSLRHIELKNRIRGFLP